MKPYAFGVDLGGTTVKIGLFETNGTLLEKWEIPTRTRNHSENLLPDIAQSLMSKLAEKRIQISDVEGIGMGVPGAVLNGSFVKPCVNLDHWGGFDVAERLAGLCGLPVKVLNDANAAALGEMSHGGGRGSQNMVFVTLGSGVGGGVIVNGKLLAGTHGAGGEIGHIKVNAHETAVCGCGKRGCLEQYASATGLLRSARELLASSGEATALRQYENLSCKDIFDCAKAGDAAALRLVDGMTRILGMALAALSCVCDPEIIVIGGGVARAGTILLDSVQKHFKDYVFPAAEETVFALAELGSDAGIYGGVQVVLNG